MGQLEIVKDRLMYFLNVLVFDLLWRKGVACQISKSLWKVCYMRI